LSYVRKKSDEGVGEGLRAKKIGLSVDDVMTFPQKKKNSRYKFVFSAAQERVAENSPSRRTQNLQGEAYALGRGYQEGNARNKALRVYALSGLADGKKKRGAE